MEFRSITLPVEVYTMPEGPISHPMIRDGQWMQAVPDGKPSELFYQLKLVPDHQPEQIDLSRDDPKEVLLGTCELKGATLTLCLNADRDAHVRPVRFATSKYSPTSASSPSGTK